MPLTITAEDRAFADEAGIWLRQQLSADLARKVRDNIRLSRDELVGWQQVLASRNWYAIGWSAEMGGPGLSPVRRYLFDRAYGALAAPHPCQFGISMAGPVIHQFGSAAQKQQHLPGICENRVFWCQGYSEPGAGSDLAALATSARRDGDSYVVNGQKIWTTWAHWADWMFCLVRTGGGTRPQEGISFLLIDMKTPGISIRPIHTLDGEAEFNEVFFDNIVVPAENLVGDEGGGWGIAKFLLEYERFSMSGSARSRRILGEIHEDVAEMGRQDDPHLQDRLTRLEIELLALEHMELALLEADLAGASPGAEASRLKIRGTEIAQGLSRLRLDLAGRRALLHDEDVLEGRTVGTDPLGDSAMPTWLNQRKLTIWGGSNEIQRMILAKQVLNLR